MTNPNCHYSRHKKFSAISSTSVLLLGPFHLFSAAMYRNFNDEPKTLDFKLWAEQFEFHTRMYFRKQEGSSPFTIEIIARRQDGYAIKNSFNYSEVRFPYLCICSPIRLFSVLNVHCAMYM